VDNARLYFRLAGARLRGQTQYRVSFALQVASSFTSTFVELLAVFILFRTFTDRGGWSVGEVAFLYGIASVAFGLVELFGSGFDNVSQMVREGEFDRVMTRPVPPFIQVLAADLQLRKIGRIAQGIVALVIAQGWTNIAWTVLKLLLALIALLSTSIVFFTTFLIGAAVCFWTIESSEVQNIFTYGGTELASNPIHIYHAWMRGAFIYIVPSASLPTIRPSSSSARPIRSDSRPSRPSWPPSSQRSSSPSASASGKPGCATIRVRAVECE